MGENIKLSFSPVPSDANTVKDLNGTEKSYDPRCIEYFFRNGDNNTRLNPNRDISVDYMVKFVGTNVFWAKYCHHSTHNDSSVDIISSEVQVVAEGYKITTVEELKAIKGTTKGYELTNDLDLGGAEWESFEFSGSIDGGGYTISNFTLSENKDNLGFFSVLTGTVSNLKFSDVSVELRGSRTNVGIVAADNRGTIESCEVSGQIEAGYASNVGGIAGRNGGTIRGCVNNATVIGGTCTGGIAGLDEKSSLENCKNYGEIQGNGNTGGIVGKTSGDVSESENFGDIFSEDSYTGGVIGYINGTFSSLSNGGDVVGEDYTGGVIGYFGTGSGEDLVSIANVTGNDHVGGFFGVFGYSVTMAGLVNESVVTGRAYVGGIAGEGGNFIDCINNGQIVTEGVLTEDRQGCSYVGGIAGKCANLEGCVNNEDVSAEGRYVGGLVGYLTSEQVEQCVNNGAVLGGDYTGGVEGYASGTPYFIDTENNGDVTGGHYTGGLIGYAAGGLIENASNVTYVQGGAYLGGIAGYFGGTLRGCHNLGEITATDTLLLDGENCSYLGGLAGYCKIVEGGTNASVISGQGRYIGGIVGYASEIKDVDNRDGSITAVAQDETLFVGGIAGYARSVSECVNHIDISVQANAVGGIAGGSESLLQCENYGKVNGYSQVGGIAGIAYIFVSLCNNFADIAGLEMIGGIAGTFTNTSYKNYRLDADNCENMGKIEGESYVGGIFGLIKALHSNIRHGTEWESDLRNLTNAGNVEAAREYAGGIAGSCIAAIDPYSTFKVVAVITVEENSNIADISAGVNYCGGIFGYCAGSFGEVYGYPGYARLTYVLQQNQNSGTVMAPANYDNLYGATGSYVKL